MRRQIRTKSIYGTVSTSNINENGQKKVVLSSFLVLDNFPLSPILCLLNTFPGVQPHKESRVASSRPPPNAMNTKFKDWGVLELVASQSIVVPLNTF
jgi:hypothetical protein